MPSYKSIVRMYRELNKSLLTFNEADAAHDKAISLICSGYCLDKESVAHIIADSVKGK